MGASSSGSSVARWSRTPPLVFAAMPHPHERAPLAPTWSRHAGKVENGGEEIDMTGDPGNPPAGPSPMGQLDDQRDMDRRLPHRRRRMTPKAVCKTLAMIGRYHHRRIGSGFQSIEAIDESAERVVVRVGNDISMRGCLR
jgi:hypothetical protein